MENLLIISQERAVIAGARAASVGLVDSVDVSAGWQSAQKVLIEKPFDCVLLDYNSLRIERADVFVALDNILSNEGSYAIMVLRNRSERAQQFLDSLSSINAVVELGEGLVDIADVRRHLLPIFRDANQTGERVLRRSDVVAAVPKPSGETVVIELPELKGGRLQSTPLARVLHTIVVTEASGTLELSAQGMVRKLAMDHGKLARARGHGGEDVLMSAFAWPDGQWRFIPGRPEAQGVVDLDEIMVQGISTYVSPNQAMSHLRDAMKLYASRTDGLDRRQEVLGHVEVLANLLERCDGRTTFEMVLGGMGSAVNEAFKMALFARDTDLMILRQETTVAPMLISYDHEQEDARPAQTPAMLAATAPAQNEQSTELQIVDAEERKQSKAYRAASDDRDLLVELRQTLASYKRAKQPHEIFGVWEGCGGDVVQERFYALVKENHPDIYGGNVSDRVKELAEEVFIYIKKAYVKLKDIEREQTVAAPYDGVTNLDDSQSGQPAVGSSHIGKEPVAVSPTGSTPGVSSTPSRTVPQRRPTPRPQRRPTPAPPRVERRPTPATRRESRPDELGNDQSEVDDIAVKRVPGAFDRSPPRAQEPPQPQDVPREGQDDGTSEEPGEDGQVNRAAQRLRKRIPSTAGRMRALKQRKQNMPTGLHVDPSTGEFEIGSHEAEGAFGRNPDGSQSSLGRSGSSSANSSSDSLTFRDISEPEVDERNLRLQNLAQRAQRRDTPAPNMPTPAQQHFREGFVAMRNQHYDIAFNEFQIAYGLDTHNLLYKIHYAFAAAKTGERDPEEALRIITGVIGPSQDRTVLQDAHFFAAILHRDIGNEERAINHFRVAARLNPGNKEAKRQVRLHNARGSAGDSSDGLLSKLFNNKK